jgi:3D (Asp-Asp-Asp) domain-containing protein
MALDLEYTPATPLDDLVLVQGRTEEMPFNIGGVTATSKDVTMTLTILLPPSHGSLITVDQQVLQSGSIITIPFGASKIPVVYKSYDDDFFSLPEPTIDAEPDVFQYKLEGYDPETGALIGSSGGDEFPALQKIHIQNVNHPHKLLATQGSVQQALSLVSGKPMATITGIEVLDKDKDINVVRVDLEVETGKLGLNEEFRHFADFDSCRVRFQESFQ